MPALRRIHENLWRQPVAQRNRFAGSTDLRKRLLIEPESGMGYQIATIGGEGEYLILNATIAIRLEASDISETVAWAAQHPTQVHAVRGAFESAIGHISTKADRVAGLAELETSPTGKVTVATHNSYPSRPSRGESFVRYSAYRNDKRIDDDGVVQPGTYVTTLTDSAMVPSGLAAVARYALPNGHPAVNMFQIEAPEGLNIRCGTTQPNYGRSGGGVEIFL